MAKKKEETTKPGLVKTSSAPKAESLDRVEFLVKQNQELLEANFALKERVDALEAAPKEAKAPVGNCAYLAGKRYEVALVDVAKELPLALNRSEIDDDQTVVVLKRHGA